MRQTILSLFVIVGFLPSPLVAETPVLGIELNAVENRAGGCRMTFVATNGLGADLSALVLEAVIFNLEGLVARLVLLDFQNLPQARPRVRQFDLPDLECAKVGQVLINEVGACTGQDLPEQACANALQPSTRIDAIKILG
ncbi:MAG: hypothetical protein ACU0B7_12985 [Paracoccaceae bacterium]